MTRKQYLNTFLPLGALALLCLAQVYPFRLRRAIAAFYFPKVSSPRAGHGLGVGFGVCFGWAVSSATHPSSSLPAQREKTRVLFLYNKLLRQRKNFLYLQRGRVARQARQPPGPVSGDRDTGCWLGLPLSLDPAAVLTRSSSQGTLLLRWCRRRWPWMRRFFRQSCTLCGTPETPRHQPCPNPDCSASYCESCWREVGGTCLVCSPAEPDLVQVSSEDEEEQGYAG